MFDIRGRTNSVGFSIIEMVVVIVVIAVIAIVSNPSFTKDQTDYATVASINMAKGSVAAAVSSTQASLLAKAGKPDSTACKNTDIIANNATDGNGQLCSNIGLIYLTRGYPAITDFGTDGAAALKPGILAAAGLTGTFNPSRAELNAKGYDFNVDKDIATFSILGSNGRCAFSYTLTPNYKTPMISNVITSGC